PRPTRMLALEPNRTFISISGQPSAGSWSLAFVILIAAIWLYQLPYNVSDLTMEPDSVEYALAPLQFLETGRYEIIVQGHALPPRYPPWFSVMMIARLRLIWTSTGQCNCPDNRLRVGRPRFCRGNI